MRLGLAASNEPCILFGVFAPHSVGRRAVWFYIPSRWFWFALLAGFARAAGDKAPAGREHTTFDGIECEYSPGQEELARSLAERFVAHNAEMSAPSGGKKSDLAVATASLTPREMRVNRPVYLGRIAGLLGLERVSPLQEECFDSFLDNYELTMLLRASVAKTASSLQVIKRVTIWSRDELVRRLEAGETIAGFSYNPVTKQGDVTFGFEMNNMDDRFKELTAKREKLHRDYQMSVTQENGEMVYRGSVSPITDAKTAREEAGPKADDRSELFPVVIPAALAALPAPELAEKLWSGAEAGSGVTQRLAQIEDWVNHIPVTDPHVGYIVLHETVELGIVEHYFHGPDRRWFCDGVANYVPWRIVRDLHGEDVAASVYNLPEQLARFAAWREKADLRKWPAVENQSTDEQHSDLDSARYAFATNVVFLMNARAGEDVLPKLFTEIGKTKANKVSIKTVEKAWKKVTGTELDPLLAAAVQPPPARPSPK